MKHLNLLRLWMMPLVVMVILSVSVPCVANTSWLNKGSELLKTMGTGEKTSALSIEDINAGLKEALRVGSENVVNQLGAADGFNKDSAVHIPLPKSLDRVRSMLSKVGMSSLFEDLELKLNRAAERAAPRAKQLFVNAISSMTLEDVNGIYEGPEDAATRYFREKMSPELALEMTPLIEDSLSKVGAIKSYDTMMKQYKSLPFVPDVKADLTDHVVEKGMDGIFYYMAREEAAIRQNPVKRTTELLKKVFNR